MIEAIIFDIGGVYLHGSFHDFVNKSYKLLGINKPKSKGSEVVFDDAYNRGLIGIEECFSNYFGVKKTNKHMNSIKELWTSTWKPEQEITEIVEKLKSNYILVVLSNSDKVNSDKYIEKGWYNPFDELILSHEVGLLKPEKKIYNIVLKRLDLPAKKCLFIDDQKECLVPAKEIGMKTIQYKSTPQLKKDLIKKGINF